MSDGSADLRARLQAAAYAEPLETLDPAQPALFRDDGNVWMAVDVLNGGNGGATNLWSVAAANPKPVGGISLAMNAPSKASKTVIAIG